jgi:hypothetical protein
VTEACPEKSKSVLGEMKAAVFAFKKSSNKVEAKDLEANPEETEVAVERQELGNE